MKPSFSKMAVMNVDEGEEIVGGWAAAHIPGAGIYKLLAKNAGTASSNGRTSFNGITA